MRLKALKHIPFIQNIKIKRPSIERFGIWYFKRAHRRAGIVTQEQNVHHLDPISRKRMFRMERGAIFRAGLAGAISAFVAAVANYYAWPLVDETTHTVTTSDYVYYWLIVGGVTVLVTLLEVLFIYIDSLRTIFKFSQISGLPLFPSEDDTSAIAYSLARAALELPNPLKSDLNVNPTKESAKWKVIISPLIYKAKIALTNFIAKMIIRRVAGRAVARVYIEFIAVPIYALWNAGVSYMVMKQARMRAFGPSFALEYVDTMLQAHPEFSKLGKEQLLRSVGSSIVRSENLHPNLEYLLYILMEQVEDEEIEGLDDTKLFIEKIKELDDDEVQFILQTLVVASALDGRVKPREHKLLADAFREGGYQLDLEAIKAFRKEFSIGTPISLPVIPLIPAPSEKAAQ